MATALEVPDFSRKLSWAEKRLEELEASIREYRDRHPYETHRRDESDVRSPWIIEFTEQADPTWALMVGDILYNLRATLDYLAGSLNPKSEDRRALFPIVHNQVWNISPIGSETKALTDERRKWDQSTRNMRPEAVALIKELQPADPSVYELQFHNLDLLNRLSNRDRHRNLHIHVTGMADPKVWYWIAEAGDEVSVWSAEGIIPHPSGVGTSAIKSGAPISLPDGVDIESVVKVECAGTATQAIKLGDDARHVEIPATLRQMLTWIRERAVTPLTPFLHGL